MQSGLRAWYEAKVASPLFKCRGAVSHGSRSRSSVKLASTQLKPGPGLDRRMG